MIVMKFGGTSLGDAQRVRNVADIIQDHAERYPLVVVSAHGKMTDRLHELATGALAGDFDTAGVRAFHDDLLKTLTLPADLLDERLDELGELLRGIYLVQELTARTLDYVVTFGERFSSAVVAAYLSSQGLPATATNAWDIGFITDSHFGAARPLPESEATVRDAVANSTTLLVVTGYMGKNREGEITTLGRGGSDFSATYIGAAIGAEEVQIWTDVDGVMTADPSIIPTAKPIEQLSFDEASELAYYGAEVIHPATMIPAIKRDIPVRVFNTFRRESPGTRIIREVKEQPGTVQSIVYRENLSLIHIVSTRMLFQHGFMAKLFEVFNKHRVVIDMIATSEVTVSLTTDSKKNIPEALNELSEFAAATAYEGKTIVCVVGEGIATVTDTPQRIFSALHPLDVDIQMISQGASKINIAFLINDAECESVVRALHTEFFEQ